ncbi:hypothetical protein PTKIN_Ptkin15bG0089300 [Pterospermum kingtungense]
MEGISATMYKSLRGYWKRKGYVKLNGTKRARQSRVELGSTRRRRRRFWRIRVKAKLRIPSPKKFFVWLRDAYVKMMLGLANSRMINIGYGGALGDGGIAAFGSRPLKEHDERMIVEIYKSLVMAQGQLVPRDPGKLDSAIISQQ